MLAFQYIAAVIISYLGLIAGFFLASMTKEEMPTARKYFPWLQRLVILVIAAVSMRTVGLSLPAKLVSYAVLLLLLAAKPNLKLFYALFGAAVFVSSKDANALLITSSLIFIFGLLSGSSSFGLKIRKKGLLKAAAKLFFGSLFYPATAIILFFLFSR